MKKLLALLLAMMMALSCAGALSEQAENADQEADVSYVTLVDLLRQISREAVLNDGDAGADAQIAAEQAEEILEAALLSGKELRAEDAIAGEPQEGPAPEEKPENELLTRDVATLNAVRAQVSMSVSPDLLKKLCLGSDFVFDAVQYLVAHSYLDVIVGEAGMNMTLMVNSKPLIVSRGRMDTDGVAFVSDLYPGYAIKVGYGLINVMMRMLNLPVSVSVNEVEQNRFRSSLEQGASTLQHLIENTKAFAPYLRDVSGFIDKMLKKATLSEDNSNIHVDVTASELNDLLDDIVDRLSDDVAILSWLESAINGINQYMPVQQRLSVERIVTDVVNMVEQARGASDFQVASLDITKMKDEKGILQISVMDRGMVTYETLDGGWLTTILLGKGGPDFSNRLASLRSGNNDSDMALILEEKNINTDSGSTRIINGNLYYGQDRLQVQVENSDIGTSEENKVSFEEISLIDPGRNAELMRYSVNTITSIHPSIPSTEGLTEIRLSKIGFSDLLGLGKSILSRGLNALAADIVRSMPDALAAMLDARNSRDAFPAADETRSQPDGDQPEETEQIDLTGVWNAEGGSLELRSNGTCTLVYKDVTYEVDYMNYDGTIFLTRNDTLITGEYTSDTLILYIGFDDVVFTR